MRERDFLRISAYPKPVDKEWRNKIDAHIEKHGVTELGPADNTNKNPTFNDGVFNFSKGSK